MEGAAPNIGGGALLLPQQRTTHIYQQLQETVYFERSFHLSLELKQALKPITPMPLEETLAAFFTMSTKKET